MDDDFARALDRLHHSVDTISKAPVDTTVPVVDSWRPVEPKEPKKETSWLPWILLLAGLGLFGYAAYILWSPKNTQPDVVIKDQNLFMPQAQIEKVQPVKPKEREPEILDEDQLAYLSSLKPAMDIIAEPVKKTEMPKIEPVAPEPIISVPEPIDGISVRGPYPFVEEDDFDTVDKPLTDAEIEAMIKAREAQNEDFMASKE